MAMCCQQHGTVYSCKVFLGGLPHDITNQGLIDALLPFGHVQIEHPHEQKECQGYTYVIFEREEQVHMLLSHCKIADGHLYYGINSQRAFQKLVEVLPWNLAGNKFIFRHNPWETVEDELKFTVFVGGIHGTLTAEALARVLDKEFKGVVRTRIDTDKLQYPIGSGVVVFDNKCSYLQAVLAEFMQVTTPKSQKVIQLDPYLVSKSCDTCGAEEGPYFCRNLDCFKYFCFSCYQKSHAQKIHATPMVRKSTTMTTLQQLPLTAANAAAFSDFILDQGPPPLQFEIPMQVWNPAHYSESVASSVEDCAADNRGIDNHSPLRIQFSPMAHSTPSAGDCMCNASKGDTGMYSGSGRRTSWVRGGGRGRGRQNPNFSSRFPRRTASATNFQA